MHDKGARGRGGAQRPRGPLRRAECESKPASTAQSKLSCIRESNPITATRFVARLSQFWKELGIR